VGKGDVFGSLIKLRSVTAHYAIKPTRLSGEVDHPVGCADSDQSWIEIDEVNVLDSMIGDL
jgi:hypothetical protein